MSTTLVSLLWVLRCLLQTRCELGLIVVVIKTSKNFGSMKSQTKKKYFMCLADSYVFGLALVEAMEYEMWRYASEYSRLSAWG